MLKVGLTGSIAVGKTHVCSVLAAHGCRVLDADRVARDVVEPGEEGLRRIVEHFGDDVLDRKGALDRAKLGSIVFRDPAKRQLLNSLLHPLVIDAQDKWLRKAEKADPNGIAVVDAALMIESGGYKRFDKLIVVWCEPEIQLRRLMDRNGLTKEEAKARIGSQMPQEEKKSYSDYLIDTSGSYESTEQRTLEVLSRLKAEVGN
ncbi:MAG: dephospho-CoA kinase [Aridibacter famidurans]|nr:dephospho-CoA kinase [Aridibacter famidurans]